MSLSEVVTQLVQAVEPLLTFSIDTVICTSLVLAHVAKTVTCSLEGLGAARVGAANARLIGDSANQGTAREDL